jgi:hypothetical protein
LQFGLDITQTSLNFGNFNALLADTFDYVLVNRGNRPINFSNFSLSNNALLSFASASGSNQSVNPGESITISVVIQAQGSAQNINETLSFNTNIPGSQSSFTIPITGNAIITKLSDLDLQHSISVYPNPIGDFFYLELEQAETVQLRLLNPSGQELAIGIMQTAQNRIEVDATKLSRGIYYLELTNGKNRIVEKLIK